MKKLHFFRAMLLPFSKTFLLFLALSFSFNFSKAQTFTKITKSINPQIGGYWEYLPINYATSGKKYPLLISLHGVGEYGNGSQGKLDTLLKSGLPKRINTPGGFPATFTVGDSTYSFIVICPQLTDGDREPANIGRLIDSCKKFYRVDSSKVYLSGFSWGGGTTEYFIANGYYGGASVGFIYWAGKYLAAAVPICGNLPPGTRAPNVVLTNLPTSFFHNSGDPTIPVSASEDWYDALIAAESSPAPLLTIFTSSSHNAWDKTYDPATKVNGLNVYEWMLQYKRVSPTKVVSFLPNPVAKIIGSRLITLPTDSTTLKGDSSTNVTAYQWKYVSGPSGYTLSSTTAANLKIKTLVAGSYTFRLITTGSGTFKDSIQYTFFVNAIPVANAGADKTITLPTDSVTLIGTATDANGNGTVSSFVWSKISGTGGTITPTNNDTTKITGLQQGVYLFKLTVTDNKGATDTDTVKVTVNGTANQTPIANAGADKVITLPTNSVTLIGTGTDTDGTISTYAWTKTAGPAATITSPSNDTTTITGLAAGTYTFRLTVTDDDGATDTDDVLVIVNQPPVANAGADKIITLPTSSVTLIGTGTDADGTISSYAWAKTAGPAATITSPANDTTTVTGLVAGIYTFRLIVKDNRNAPDTDYVQVTVNPAEIDKFINVNIYGGTDAYSDTAWNNWNVGTGAGTNITSGTFNYSDATASAVNAVLSHSTAVNDNGATYSGGMAPAEVLRHVSYSTLASRTLTLNGLSTSKTYDIELYASRLTNYSDSTAFTINSTTQKVRTYQNYTNKVEFTDISSDVSGHITITMAPTLNFTYINGFKLTEKAGGSLRVVTKAPATQAVTTTEKTFTDKKALSVSPNPANDKILLQLNNPYKGALRVQFVDINGKVQKELSYKKDQQLFRQNIPVNQLTAGSYILQLNIGTWKASTMVLKQ